MTNARNHLRGARHVVEKAHGIQSFGTGNAPGERRGRASHNVGKKVMRDAGCKQCAPSDDVNGGSFLNPGNPKDTQAALINQQSGGRI